MRWHLRVGAACLRSGGARGTPAGPTMLLQRVQQRLAAAAVEPAPARCTRRGPGRQRCSTRKCRVVPAGRRAGCQR